MGMNVNLTPQLEELVRAKVASGLYTTASEVVREALRLMGAAVDAPSDAQQFMFPITIPLLVGYMGLFVFVLQDPSSSTSFWLSIIPLTSPIAMMGRISYGVPFWELGLSMGLLVLGFLGTTWLAAKIYRIGILMHGTKPSYKVLWKWLRSSYAP